jgi:hypothetical protein
MNPQDGIYEIDYVGQQGEGFGGITNLQGRIEGLALGPMTIRGTVDYHPNGGAELDFVMQPAADPTQLVTGPTVDRSDRIPAKITLTPQHFAGAQTFKVPTVGGNIDVRLIKLRP